ncbi:MAG: pro-sigmaK processing inhibitor BofA family protein [Hespellia sp.]|nr:pro-sigmaK processing inhibitor BofA family protein [Hespellia sp.]
MKNKIINITVNFIVRAIFGLGLIFFINEFLSTRGFETMVGLNVISLLTSGILGIPGVCLLYGIAVFQIL